LSFDQVITPSKREQGTMSEKKKRTVAVIGSGMAGLVTAHLLHNDPRQRYQVQLLEKVRMQVFKNKNRNARLTVMLRYHREASFP
jgi:hypothetical protein